MEHLRNNNEVTANDYLTILNKGHRDKYVQLLPDYKASVFQYTDSGLQIVGVFDDIRNIESNHGSAASYAVFLDPTTITDESYLEWREKLPYATPEELSAAASEIITARGDTPIAQILVSCESCAETPDTNCRICGGTGEYGLYPTLSLVNVSTDERRDIILDVAAILQATPDIIGEKLTVQESFGTKEAASLHSFKLKEYVDNQLIDMGVDLDNCAVILNDNGVSELEDHFNDRSLLVTKWREGVGTMLSTPFSGQVKYNQPEYIPSAHESIIELQKSLSKSFGNRYDRKAVRVDINRYQYDVRPIRPFTDCMSDLIQAASRRGYTLGFSHSGSATGETEPTFFLMGQDGQIIYELSQESNIRIAAEQAWLILSRAINENKI